MTMKVSITCRMSLLIKVASMRTRVSAFTVVLYKEAIKDNSLFLGINAAYALEHLKAVKL